VPIGLVALVAAIRYIPNSRFGAPEPELTAVVDATADAQLAGEAAVPVEPQPAGTRHRRRGRGGGASCVLAQSIFRAVP
jgi:hypothetical protein